MMNLLLSILLLDPKAAHASSEVSEVSGLVLSLAQALLRTEARGVHFVRNYACKDWLEENPLGLDRHSPNVSNHCEEGHQGDRHQLDNEVFWMLLGDQLRQSRGDACQLLGVQGARGALFKVTLTSHGIWWWARGQLWPL